jgi:hypothetical protein
LPVPVRTEAIRSGICPAMGLFLKNGGASSKGVCPVEVRRIGPYEAKEKPLFALFLARDARL